MSLKPRALFIALLEFYQKQISFLLPCSCRFWPSCSEYAKQAVSKYGILKGGTKATGRLLRCHPLSGKSGYDPLA
ncbi:MAG: membrane protein insertion efficiency factor YidD [Candidatus Omnitrophica bacterium]|nr:membrane protein insertion efficiency factor YidD [Candidatus Omnitrophota bacterium]